MEQKTEAQGSLSNITRLTGFSDAVFAVLITITVLDIHAPAEPTLHGLFVVAPVFFAYVLSFTNLGIYWNNHHHLLYTVKKVSTSIMWTNLLLLFFLSLIPFSTAWIGMYPHSIVPSVTYGIVLLLSAIAYSTLQNTILKYEHAHSPLRKAIGSDIKGKLSSVILIIGVLTAFIMPWLSYVFYVTIVLMWIIPDKRLEAVLKD